MSWKDVRAECGCVIEMDISHDWESGTTDAEDGRILTLCKTHTPQSQTIERLADALEFALNPFTYKTWPEHWTLNDVEKATAAARALLAEIRGKHE